MDWPATFARIRAENLAAGKCPDCAAAGVVFVARTSDPHAERTCRTCRGTGLPRAKKPTTEEGT